MLSLADLSPLPSRRSSFNSLICSSSSGNT
jgi:hypothetical protein